MPNGCLFAEPVESEGAFVLTGSHRDEAARTIRRHHYTSSVPSGKSVYVRFGPAIVIWSIPANKNIARFLFGWDANVWELSRLWAPDGHERNLLTRAIAAAVRIIKTRAYRDRAGNIVARRKFHSGSRGLRKAEIEALGFVELRLPGKHRFVRPLTFRAKKALRLHQKNGR
jgi:hypothetical protein